MALIENKISIDKDSTNKIVKSFQKLLKFLTNQPKWLLFLTIFCITSGGFYFWYSSRQERSNIKVLQEQVVEINKVVNSSLGVQELIYIITEIKILHEIQDENFNECQNTIDVLSSYINRTHPGDQSISDLTSIKKRMELNEETYNQHFSYIMKKLDNVVSSDSTSSE